jgi:ATP-dependent exoDNAse (exonuclease V) alpha subunit
MMLRRNLLYTAITRAKKLAVLFGSERALAAAVRTPAPVAATLDSPTASTGWGLWRGAT